MKQYRYKKDLIARIDEYFEKTITNLPSSKIIEHPTMSGLAVHLGFESRDELELYESKGLFKKQLKIARFRMIAYYESRLLFPASKGALLALKSMGWTEPSIIAEQTGGAASININVVETGPPPASSEKEIQLENLTLNKHE